MELFPSNGAELLSAIDKASVDDQLKLERRLIDDYGESGGRLLLKSWNHFEKGKPDVECPWGDLNFSDPAAIVDVLLSSLDSVLPEFVSLLSERIKFVVPTYFSGTWNLAYFTERNLHDGTLYFEVTICGSPNQTPQLSGELLEEGWILPVDLIPIYAIHDGIKFGKYSDSGLYASNCLVSAGKMMNEIQKSINGKTDGYQFDDLLEYSGDGCGNTTNFWRRSKADPNPLAVDWDHEPWEISPYFSFYEQLDEMLSCSIKDEE